MNSSLVALIFKVADSVRVTDFCPIVMGNFTYKIFTKVIATRLGSFIGEILSPCQYGFIPGCNIHTCTAIASKIVNSLHMGKPSNMAIKVDISKAFDTISWDFLYCVLHCMGFSSRFVHLIKGILGFAEEALIRWIDYFITNGQLTVHKKLPRYLIYADDIMFFLETTRSSGRGIKSLLDAYGNVSGQKFNPSKSSIIYGTGSSPNVI